MFWKFQPPIPQIDSILDKEDITLAEILDEDGIVQECKTLNRKLISFLMQPENVEALIKLVITEPSVDLPDLLKYKHANIACEILNGDIEDVVDVVFGMTVLLPEESNKYLDLLCSFVDQNAPLNPLLASFFMKVLSGLAMRRGKRMVAYLRNRPNFLSRLLYHMSTPAIMDLLLKLIQQTDPTSKTDVAEWFSNDRLVNYLVDGMHPDKSEMCHSNSSYLLCELLTICREQVAYSTNNTIDNSSDCSTVSPHLQLLDVLESAPLLDQILTFMLAMEPKKSVVINCLSYFQAVLDKRPSENSLDLNPLFFSSPTNPIRLLQATSTLANIIEPKLPEIKALLHSPPKQEYSVMETTVGILLPPLGLSRLQTVQLLNYLFALNYANLNKALYQVNVIDAILDLFKQYPWNSFLHNHVLNIVTSILTKVPATIPPDLDEGDEEENFCLIKQLIVQCQLVKRLLCWYSDNQRIEESEGKRRGYMGHIVNMMNLIQENISAGPNVDIMKFYFNQLDEEVQRNWDSFISNDLKELNSRNQLDMPSGSYFAINGDEDFRHLTYTPSSNAAYGFTEESVNDSSLNIPDGDYFQPVPIRHGNSANLDVFQPANSCINTQSFNLDSQSGEKSSLFSLGTSHSLHETNSAGLHAADSDDVWLDRDVVFTNDSTTGQALSITSSLPPSISVFCSSESHSCEPSLSSQISDTFGRDEQLIAQSYPFNHLQTSDLSFDPQSVPEKYRIDDRTSLTTTAGNEYSTGVLPPFFPAVSQPSEEAMEISSIVSLSAGHFLSNDGTHQTTEAAISVHQSGAVTSSAIPNSVSDSPVVPDSSQWRSSLSLDSANNLSLPYNLSRIYDISNRFSPGPPDIAVPNSNLQKCSVTTSQLNEAMDTSDCGESMLNSTFHPPVASSSMPRSSSMPADYHSSYLPTANSVKSFLSTSPVFTTGTTAADPIGVVASDSLEFPRGLTYSYHASGGNDSSMQPDTGQHN